MSVLEPPMTDMEHQTEPFCYKYCIENDSAGNCGMDKYIEMRG